MANKAEKKVEQNVEQTEDNKALENAVHVSNTSDEGVEGSSDQEGTVSEGTEDKSNVVNIEGAQAKDSAVPDEVTRSVKQDLKSDDEEIADEVAAEAEDLKEEGQQDGQKEQQEKRQRRRAAPKRPKRVSMRNPYYTYENPTALIDHCYHSWRINDGQWHQSAFYEKILYSDWKLSLNDIFAMGRLEPNFMDFLLVVRQLILSIKIVDTKYIDGQFHGPEFDWNDMEALLSAIAYSKSCSYDEFERFKEAVLCLPRPIVMKRIKRKAMRYGVTDIASALHAHKLGIIDAKLTRHFCFSFELDPDHKDFNPSYARCARSPR